mmetsp:Transcript_44721/g.95110  ORF Transcript_44721/g.95110 Transcript_44721/m.95110 type:complete len:258 (-) Transcript_44721:491-1264(-)
MSQSDTKYPNHPAFTARKAPAWWLRRCEELIGPDVGEQGARARASAHGGHCAFLVDGHEACEEGLQVEDGLLPALHAVLVDGGVVQSLVTYCNGHALQQRLHHVLHDHLWGDARAEELVELAADLEELLGALLVYHVVGDGADEELPVGKLNWLVLGEGVLVHLARLKGENGAAQVALTRGGDTQRKRLRQLEALLVCDVGQHSGHLLMRWRGDAYTCTSRPNRSDYFARIGAAQQQPARADVLLHGPAERMLSRLA